MRRALIVSGLCLSGCGGELILETFSDAEGGGGPSEMTLEGSTVRLRERQAGADRRSHGELTPGGLDALTLARAAVTRTIADAVEQCGIADTTHFVYHLEDTRGSFLFSHCRSSEFAPEVAALVAVIDDILVGLRGCEDNAIVEVKGACFPAF